jgi:hypothetical protein
MEHLLLKGFDDLPDVTGILMAALAFALVFVPELLEKLAPKKRIRWLIAAILAIFGIAGLSSSHVQRSRSNADQASLNTTIRDLNGQVAGLQVTESKLQNVINEKLNPIVEQQPSKAQQRQAEALKREVETLSQSQGLSGSRPDYGNLKDRTIELVAEIKGDLQRHGFWDSSHQIAIIDMQQPDWEVRWTTRIEWESVVFFPRAKEIRDEYASLHHVDDELDEDLSDMWSMAQNKRPFPSPMMTDFLNRLSGLANTI